MLSTQMDKTNQQVKTPGETLSPKTKRGKHQEVGGSRWAGLILLIITFIVSLFFYARGGLDPAKYSIRK